MYEQLNSISPWILVTMGVQIKQATLMPNEKKKYNKKRKTSATKFKLLKKGKRKTNVAIVLLDA